MAHATEVCVWFPAMKLDALKTELDKQDTTVEIRLLAKLEELYEQTIPEARRAEIGAILAEQDRLAAEEDARRKAESYRVSAMHIHRNGWSEYWKMDRAVDFLLLARLLRKTFQLKHNDLVDTFAAHMHDRDVISEAEYEVYARAMRNGNIHVSGVYDLDFSRQTLTVTDLLERSWKTYRFNDVSVAAYRADRKEGLSWKEAIGRLEKALAGKCISVTTFPAEPTEG